MHRRSFLRQLLATPVAAASFLYGNPLRAAHAAANKTLVVIFQRGGCDGLNTMIPYGDDDYYRLRPTLAIAPPNPLNLASAIDLNDGFFGLHPALKPLSEIYQENKLAILPAVHYSNGSTSHFEGQHFIESGVPSALSDGWINRYLKNSSPVGEIPAASFGGNLSHALKGDFPVPTFADLANFPQKHELSLNRLRSVIDQPVNSGQLNRVLLHLHQKRMIENIDIINSIDIANYSPSNGSIYPDSKLGKQLRQIGQLIKAKVGLEVATVNSEDWDTHANQGAAEGHHAVRLADFSSSISALYDDLGPSLMQDVVILTMTEFGRTAKENASGGTDHGNAATWFVISGAVKGGIYGDWPGLGKDHLYKGRYLTYNIEYSDVLGELIHRHLGGSNSLSSILPGHDYSPVGFL